jgi:hypothetical protein
MRQQQISRRSLLLKIGAPFLLPVASRCSAQEGATIAEYSQAVNYQRRGIRCLDVVRKMESALSKEPAQTRYRLLLACALVGRVSSLTRATVFEETHARNQAKYARWKAEWEAAQQDRTNPAYGTLPPPLPPVRLTADDNQPFLWNRRETTAHIETLSLRAVQEFETAVTGESHRLSTTEQQAEDLWIYGCGLLLLCRPANYLAPLDATKKEYSTVFSVQKAAAKAVGVLRRASELVPDSARYWQALGDIHYFLADWRINASEEARKENL